MLDPRLYRVAFVPALLALLVAAFSIGDRPRPVRTTLAPDTFQGANAMTTLNELASRYPNRRPGSAGDDALASYVAGELRRLVPGTIEVHRFRGRTIDGRRNLVNVVATRPGRPGPGIVVVAHRDAAGTDARAELSGTAALLELARVAGNGRLQRTITFISTTGGSGGFAGAREAARRMGARANAVIVLGDLASARPRRPFVVGFSDGVGQAPIQLQRTLQSAVRAEAHTDPGGPRALTQALRMAVPVTVGEQGPFLRAGQPAVLVSASGERPPPAGAPVREERVQAFGRAVLRALYALDNAPRAVGGSPTRSIVLRGKVLPGWVVALVVGTLLLPPLVAGIDALARLRRRGEYAGPWMAWTLSAGLPLALGCGVALLLAASTLLTVAPGAPIPARGLEVGGRAIVAAVALAVVVGLGWAVGRPALLRAAGLRPRAVPEGPAPGIGVGLAVTLVVVALWIVNPYAAALALPAAHLWLWATAPDTGMRRVWALALIAAGLVPLVALALVDTRAFGYGPVEAVWSWVLLVAGGHVPVISWVLWSLFWGCAISAAIIVVRRVEASDAPEDVTVRGPVSYAGPGSLGGTESALRR